MYLYMIIGLVFVSAFLLVFSALYTLSTRRDPVKARLEQLATDARIAAPGAYDFRTSLLRKGVDLLASDVSRIATTREWLTRAGYLRSNAVYDYYLVKIILTLALATVAVIIGMQLHMPSIRIVLLGLAGAVVGIFAPNLWVNRKISSRRDAIRRAVPNMLDLMVVCVEAGLSFTAALHKLADEMKQSCPPLAQELKIVTQEILIGKPKPEVFRSLAQRTEVEELRSLAVTLIQADRLGTSIATSLRVLADTMRFKRRQRAEEEANKVSVKLVFPLVLLIFPELLIILVGPALINIFKTLKGTSH